MFRCERIKSSFDTIPNLSLHFVQIARCYGWDYFYFDIFDECSFELIQMNSQRQRISWLLGGGTGKNVCMCDLHTV